MRIENGKAIYETRECWNCKGTGKYRYGITCPLWGKSVFDYPKHKCPKCGATNKHSHNLIGHEVKNCDICNGKGYRLENSCDYMPDSQFQSLTFKVYRSNRKQTMNEYLLGFECVFSCTDYGEHKRLSDAELIDKVKHSHGRQYCKVIDKDNNICDHVGIFCNDSGYSVRPVYNQIPNIDNTEIERDSGMLRGQLLASRGLLGTYAVYK